MDHGEAWGVYTMDISLPHGSRDNRNESLSFRYTGSSIGGYDDCGFMGLQARILHGHERVIDRMMGLSPDEVAEYRSQGFASFVHETASYPGAKRTYHKTMVFPAIEEATLLQSQVKQLVLFCEAAVMLYDDTFDRLFATSGSRSGMLSKKLSCELINSLRPAHMPRPPWLGTNRALPHAGRSVGIASLEMRNDRMPETLMAIYNRKGSTYLTGEDIEHAKAEFARLKPDTIWPYTCPQIRRRFKAALAQRGIKTTSSSIKESILQVLPIFAAVKEYMSTKISQCSAVQGTAAVASKGQDLLALFQQCGLRIDWHHVTSRLQSVTEKDGGWPLNAQETESKWSKALRSHKAILLEEENWKQLSGEWIRIQSWIRANMRSSHELLE